MSNIPPIITPSASPACVNTVSNTSSSQKKSIPIALIILGLIGAGVAGLGLAVFGRHQDWWGLGGLSNLNQVDSIIMMSVGGGILLLTILKSIAKNRPRKAQATLPKEIPCLPLNLKGGSCRVDASYDHENDSGILDLAYCNPELGFGCIVDGTGHNNPRMRTALQAHFNPFIEGYANGLKNVSTYEEAVQYFEEQVRRIENQFSDKTLPLNRQKITDKSVPPDADVGTFLDPAYKPAMSFVQLVRLQDKLFLLTAQAGDAMVVVEMPNGKLLRKPEKSTHYGVGDSNIKITVEPPHDITGAKRVIGFSDGIGEFLTFEELQEIINANKDSALLFGQLTTKVISQQELSPEKRAADKARAANGTRRKLYQRGDDPGLMDDMSLFALDISSST